MKDFTARFVAPLGSVRPRGGRLIEGFSPKLQRPVLTLKPPLLPKDLHGRARVRSLAAMLASDTHPLVTPRVRKYLSTIAGFEDDAVRAWMQHWFSTGLAAFEQHLAAEPATARFCHGDAPTMADMCLASIMAVTRVLKLSFDGLPSRSPAVTVPDFKARMRSVSGAELSDQFSKLRFLLEPEARRIARLHTPLADHARLRIATERLKHPRIRLASAEAPSPPPRAN